MKYTVTPSFYGIICDNQETRHRFNGKLLLHHSKLIVSV